MLKKVCVATLVGTAFVIGNSYGFSHTSNGITKTSGAYDELLGFGLAKDGTFTPSCDSDGTGFPKIFTKNCECVIEHCESMVSDFVTKPNDAYTCLEQNCFGTANLKCFLKCVALVKGTPVYECVKENKCL